MKRGLATALGVIAAAAIVAGVGSQAWNKPHDTGAGAARR